MVNVRYQFDPGATPPRVAQQAIRIDAGEHAPARPVPARAADGMAQGRAYVPNDTETWFFGRYA